jgi:hypothetical protein
MSDFLKSLRRTMRFRMLLLVAAVLVPDCAVIAVDQLDESQAIREIERLGGTVMWDDKLPDRPVTAVDFIGSQRLRDKDLYLLKTLMNLTTLNLGDCRGKFKVQGAKFGHR